MKLSSLKLFIQHQKKSRDTFQASLKYKNVYLYIKWLTAFKVCYNKTDRKYKNSSEKQFLKMYIFFMFKYC